MKNQKQISNIFFLLVLLLNVNFLAAQSLSQEVIGSSGGININQNIGNLHWKTGETIVKIIGNENEFYLAQGFHQLYHDLLVTDTKNVIENAENMQLYPNPTLGVIFLEFSENTPKNIRITNQLGQILLQYEVYKNGDKIDLSTLANGIYFINVLNQHQLIKTFKAIKI